MKQWVAKLLEQLDFSSSPSADPKKEPTVPALTEEKATILYMIDTYNKHLFEVEKHSVRKVREKLDNMAKALLSNDPAQNEKTLFELRQFFSSYRIDEYSYIQNTFDDFKRIIWDFADQLGEDVQFENQKDKDIGSNLKQLREAVEANSIETLRAKSREFINAYVEYQNQKNDRRTKRLSNVKKNLDTVKKQLMEANASLHSDHLTGAFNRKSFDEAVKKNVQMAAITNQQVSLLILDIDFFKKINDNYGHDIGDFVLKECVGLLKEVFHREDDMVCRIGGEEFAVILPNHAVEHAVHRAEEAQKRIRKEAFIQGTVSIKFTVSIGIAQLLPNETASEWMKRADLALYQSKNTGRDKYTVSDSPLKPTKVA